MTIAHDFDGFLIDLDGVVYVGETLVPGADDAIRSLRADGKRLLFLTNDPPRPERDATLLGEAELLASYMIRSA